MQLQSAMPRFVIQKPHDVIRQLLHLTAFPDRKIRGISMGRKGPQTHFLMLRHRAGSTPDTKGHGLIGKRLECESANC